MDIPCPGAADSASIAPVSVSVLLSLLVHSDW
jgi:hypothetical protein